MQLLVHRSAVPPGDERRRVGRAGRPRVRGLGRALRPWWNATLWPQLVTPSTTAR